MERGTFSLVDKGWTLDLIDASAHRTEASRVKFAKGLRKSLRPSTRKKENTRVIRLKKTGEKLENLAQGHPESRPSPYSKIENQGDSKIRL